MIQVSKTPKIVITGGLGFIFSHVTEYFVAKGWQVIVIDNLSEGSHPEIINDTFVHYNQDVAERGVIEIIQKENPDFVIHAAAISCVDHSIANPYDTLRKNILGNLNIFEACRNLSNLKKFIYVSTDEVYGECGHRKKEDEIIFPKNPYSCSKAVGSLLRITHDNTYPDLKDKTAETRFCNVFGPRQDSRKIMSLIKRGLNEEISIPLHGDGAGYREYIYVKDIPPALDLILDKGNRTYNITLNNGLTVQELIQKAEKITGKKINTHSQERLGMDLKYQMDNTRIKVLGWKPKYTFENALKEYLCEK